MAGDWIKMRVDLADDPAVISMASQLSVSEHTIVGALHKFWSWADKHTTDGNAVGVTTSWLNRYIMLPDFAETMISVGWLAQKTGGICIPKFENHNGETGKKRAVTNKRVAEHRVKANKTGNENVTLTPLPKALPEKRREEYLKEGASPLVLPDWVPLKNWNSYLDMRKKAKKAPTERAKELVITELEKLKSAGENIAAVLDQSVMRNWTDVYAVKEKSTNTLVDPFRGVK